MKNNKKHKRLPPREYRLSDDFLITYSVEINKRNKNKENYIVRYNIPKPLSKTQKKRNKKNYGCMILDQSLRVVVPTEGHNEINKILLNKIWEKDDTHQKVKIAIEEILTHKDNKKRISGVSLYLFVYMYYDDIKKRYSFDDEFFSALINDTDIRNIFLSSETTEDDITKAADSFYKKNQRTTKTLLGIYDLSTDERHEFDFLAHFLEMKDILTSENFLTYKVVRKRRKLYLEEIKNYKLNSIIYSERLFKFHPWNCLEFGEQKSAVSELDKINIFWIQEFHDMIINLENGKSFHFCLDNEFDINYKPINEFLDFGPVDDDFSDDDALVVTDYGEKLRNIDTYYDGNKEINRVHVTIFPDEIGLERLHARKRFLG
jgi:hypothetical protein